MYLLQTLTTFFFYFTLVVLVMTLKIPAKLWLAKVGIAKNILHMLFCILFMMNNFFMKCMTLGLKVISRMIQLLLESFLITSLKWNLFHR